MLLLACYFIFIQRQQLYFVLILHMFRNIGNMYMHLNKYCGIIRNCGGSIVVVFVDSPPQRIYILNENKSWKSRFLTETENRRIHKFTSLLISQKNPTIHDPPSPNLNDSTVSFCSTAIGVEWKARILFRLLKLKINLYLSTLYWW